MPMTTKKDMNMCVKLYRCNVMKARAPLGLSFLQNPIRLLPADKDGERRHSQKRQKREREKG